uniref:Uncharacterized protein n=1 Tax=Zea mays TaxID=4577 RepID=C0HIH8_MAIZE|nr:unknown [Zea mays]
MHTSMGRPDTSHTATQLLSLSSARMSSTMRCHCRLAAPPSSLREAMIPCRSSVPTTIPSPHARTSRCKEKQLISLF